MSQPVTVSVDLGYGHVKAVTRAGGTLVRERFPSFASLNTGSGGATSIAEIGRLDVVHVAVGDAHYTVGKDTTLMKAGSVDRNRDTSYSTTDQYMALMLGAFWYMRREVIDVLMVGLPMNTYERYADSLKSKLTGRHVIPNFKSGNRGGDAVDTISVHVRAVKVVAQPVGALTVATIERPDLRRANALVLDLGFNTLDMLGLSGGKPRMDRAAAFPGGVAAYIDDIRKSFNEWVKTTHAQELAIPHHHFEEALRDNKPLQCMLGELPLDPHVKRAAARLDQYMDLVAAKLGEAGDISVAVLAGGGAALMVEPFKRKYPLLRNVIVVKDPQFAIVLGYQEIGEKLAARFVSEAVGG